MYSFVVFPYVLVPYILVFTFLRDVVWVVDIKYLLDTKDSIRERQDDKEVDYHEATTVRNGLLDQSHHPAESVLCPKVKYKLPPNKQCNASLDVPEAVAFPVQLKAVVNDEHIVDRLSQRVNVSEPVRLDLDQQWYLRRQLVGANDLHQDNACVILGLGPSSGHARKDNVRPVQED